jgi:hypothetical protein
MKIWFISIIILLALPSVACSQVQQQSVVSADSVDVSDSAIYAGIINRAKSEQWHMEPLSSIEIKVARCFLDVPYVGGTLEAEGEEQLVVNLRAFDCTTFVENVLVISMCIKNGSTTFKQYKENLIRTRYRNGVVDGYPSRLHYFTDWLIDNQQRGIVSIVSQQMGTQPFDPSVGFMSANPNKYKALREHPEFVPVIAAQEERINKLQLLYIPKDEVPAIENQIIDGDIIAITTTLEGLDIVHVGIACHQNERLYMLHDSSTYKKVVMTQVPLADYLAEIKMDTGIIVARAID